jgi:hypothetical protein
MSYPKWLYHADKNPELVKDEAAHSALGEGWVESPALCVKKPAAPEKAAHSESSKKRENKSAGSSKQ